MTRGIGETRFLSQGKQARRIRLAHRHRGDMLNFNLARQFDAIVCLSAIAYALTVSRLQQTLQTMSRHLRSRGVVIAEPFLKPEDVSLQPALAG